MWTAETKENGAFCHSLASRSNKHVFGNDEKLCSAYKSRYSVSALEGENVGKILRRIETVVSSSVRNNAVQSDDLKSLDIPYKVAV